MSLTIYVYKLSMLTSFDKKKKSTKGIWFGKKTDLKSSIWYVNGSSIYMKYHTLDSFNKLNINLSPNNLWFLI